MRVLVIEDDEVDYLKLERTFAKAFPARAIHLKCISNPAGHDLYAEIPKYDICLIDQNIGVHSGLQIIHDIAQNDCLTPMILLTGENNPMIDKKASEIGASDYLVKDDLTPELLNRSVRFSLAQKDHEKKLTKLAFIDGLTGLANRTKFDQALELSLQTTKRNGTYLALLMIDLDNFKIINDTFGHPAGDKILKETAQRLQNTIRESDLVARFGGDEFCVLINGYQQEHDIILVKDKIMDIFNAPIHFEQQILSSRGSIGIAIMTPEQTERKASDLLRSADHALYRAKWNGKNACEFSDNNFNQNITKIGEFERALKNAVTHQELELYFQPKINSGTREVCGTEALLRWNNQDLGLIAPNDFIPLAERSASILNIGRWVIEEACTKLRQWIDDGYTPLPVAVNISPLQIQEETFVSHIQETLQKYDLDPSLLELEITETALMENWNHLSSRLQALAEIGCLWVIDDFGVGYSSLSRLKDLPINKIKLDRFFTTKLETSLSCQKICNIVTLLAKELDLILVVEGIERSSQIDHLQILDKDELQGFLFSKPVPEYEFRQFLTRENTSLAQRVN